MSRILRPGSLLGAALGLSLALQAKALTLDQFQEDREWHGFTCQHLYQDSQGRTAGACLVHESGFTVDLLPLETAPQAFVWVATPVTGNRGEPHTLEHLLLGKGRRGLSVANAEEFRLSSSSAFTGQLETCYHFSTALGEADFLTEFGDRLDALMHPDFSDEEIRREVCHVGPKTGPDGLELEEKGTVYTEMLSSWDNGWSRASHVLNAALYGADHPQAAYQGGLPADIRRLKPQDIRDFQHDSHFLGNMGVELVLPAGGMNEPLLARLDSLLRRLEPERTGLSTRKRGDLPPLLPSRDVLTQVVEVPGSREGEPALLLAAWPPTRNLGRTDFLFAQLFLQVAASGESSDLYHELIDATHAQDPLGAAWLSMWIEDAPGQAVWLGMGSLPPARVTEAGLAEIRTRVLARLGEIAAWTPESGELEALKQRALAQLASQRRAGRSLLDHPPGFGERGTGSFWADHLRNLRATEQFRLRLDEEPALAELEQRLQQEGNPFAPLLDELGLLKTTPHVVGTRSNPALLEQKETERLARLEAFADSLETAYGVTDRQEAMRRFAADYDKVTAELEAQRAGLPVPALPATLPLDYDPEIVTDTLRLTNDIPLCHGVFEGMQGANFNLAVDISQLGSDPIIGPFLSILPALLTQSGVTGPDGELDFRHVEDALRREVSWAGCWIDSDVEAGRAELVFTAAGANPEECVKGLQWLQRFLKSPNWTEQNRSRLLEIVRRELANVRETRKGSEESWVDNPAASWSQRSQPGLLHAGCFLTQEWDLFRLAWDLKGNRVSEETAARLASWTSPTGSETEVRPDSCRARLRRLIDTPPEDRSANWARELGTSSRRAFNMEELATVELVLRDVEALSAELPDVGFAADWARICGVIQSRRGLGWRTPLLGARHALQTLAPARAWFTGSRASWESIQSSATAFAAFFANPPAQRNPIPATPQEGTVAFGLVEPGLSSGVAILHAPLTWQHAWTQEDLLNLLAGNLLGGGSDQGLFMQTWAAGLAYSNGIRPRERTGQLRYYAERCPDISQTLSFVEDRVRQAALVDAARARTALITALGGSRTAQDYAERTRQRALEMQLVDHGSPAGLRSIPHTAGPTRLDDLRAFRRGLIGLLEEPTLPQQLEARKLAVHARVFPGLAEGVWQPLPGTQLFFIGPERQLERADEFLSKRASGQNVHRVRPRDFWLSDTSSGDQP